MSVACLVYPTAAAANEASLSFVEPASDALRGEIDAAKKVRPRIGYGLCCIDNGARLFDLWIVLLTLFSKESYRRAV